LAFKEPTFQRQKKKFWISFGKSIVEMRKKKQIASFKSHV
jgi:hypothetical protein